MGNDNKAEEEFRRGIDEVEHGGDHKTFGISTGEWENKIKVFGDEQLRDSILRYLYHRHGETDMEALTGIGVSTIEEALNEIDAFADEPLADPEPLSEGMVRKGGVNPEMSRVVKRPPAPGSMKATQVTDEMVEAGATGIEEWHEEMANASIGRKNAEDCARACLEVALPTPPAPAPDAGEWQAVMEQAAHVELGLACRPTPDVNDAVRELLRLLLPFRSSPPPTPQPPAVEAEVVDRYKPYGNARMTLSVDGRWIKYANHEAALKAKTDENERQERVIAGLNRQLTEQFDLTSKQADHILAAEAELTEMKRIAQELSEASRKHHGEAHDLKEENDTLKGVRSAERIPIPQNLETKMQVAAIIADRDRPEPLFTHGTDERISRPVRPDRVQAAFEVFHKRPETGPSATAMFAYIEHLEREVLSYQQELRDVYVKLDARDEEVARLTSK